MRHDARPPPPPSWGGLALYQNTEAGRGGVGINRPEYGSPTRPPPIAPILPHMTNPAPAPTGLRTTGYRDAVRNRLRLRYWHEAIIDDMLINPFSTIKERAARLGYTEGWLSLVTNSDMFKAAFAARRQQFNEQIAQSASQKLARVADAGLDAMLSILEKKRDSLPFDKVAEATTSVLDRLGFSPPAKGGGAAPTVQVNVGAGAGAQVQVSPEQLAEARARLRQVETHTAEATPPALEGPFRVLNEPSTTPSGPLIEGEVEAEVTPGESLGERDA